MIGTEFLCEGDEERTSVSCGKVGLVGSSVDDSPLTLEGMGSIGGSSNDERPVILSERLNKLNIYHPTYVPLVQMPILLVPQTKQKY